MLADVKQQEIFRRFGKASVIGVAILISNGCTVAFGCCSRASWRHATAVADHPQQ